MYTSLLQEQLEKFNWPNSLFGSVSIYAFHIVFFDGTIDNLVTLYNQGSV